MYKNHKEIPTKYRRLILEETLEKRVSKVPLSVCNEIITEHLDCEEENRTLKDYVIEYIKDGVHDIKKADNRQDALVILDRILDYGENKDPSVIIAIRQAGRLVSGYVKCEWMYPEPKDKLVNSWRIR